MNPTKDSDMTPLKVVIVGLGEIARTHLAVLEQFPEIVVTAGVDPHPPHGLTFRGRPLPIHVTLDGVPSNAPPDVVVVATPSATHAQVCRHVARMFPAARVLVEKPAATTLDDAHELFDHVAARHTVEVAYHMAHSPEVTWAVELTRRQADSLGRAESVHSWFSDAYSDQFDTAAVRLGNSWLDSGINALSVLARFVDPVERTALRQLGTDIESTFEAHLTCQHDNATLNALVVTSWHVTDPAKTTRIRYTSGTELVMDHTAVAAYLTRDDRITDLFGRDRGIPRRERHYHALYGAWLIDHRSLYSARTSRHLHDLLLAPADNDRPQ